METIDQQKQTSGLGTFTILVLIIQGLGLAAVILVAVWMGHYRGGFAWQSDPNKEFNYHPLFMIIGMIFLYADGILAYRVFRNVRKLYIKALHGGIHVAALIFAAVGLKAVFDFHNLSSPPKANMYSLHSWLGLTSVILFGLQWVCGFVSFAFPGLSLGLKKYYMQYHVFFGLAILCMASAASLMGITEKAIFLMFDTKAVPPMPYPAKPTEGIVLNCLGIVIVAFVTLVGFVVTRSEYKRQPSPEEEHIQLMDN